MLSSPYRDIPRTWERATSASIGLPSARKQRALGLGPLQELKVALAADSRRTQDALDDEDGNGVISRYDGWARNPWFDEHHMVSSLPIQDKPF